MNDITSLSFKPTDEMRRAFDRFLQHEFSDISRPEFQNESDRDSAIRCWWYAEMGKRHAIEKINSFRHAFYDLTGIG